MNFLIKSEQHRTLRIAIIISNIDQYVCTDVVHDDLWITLKQLYTHRSLIRGHSFVPVFVLIGKKKSTRETEERFAFRRNVRVFLIGIEKGKTAR